MTAISAVPPPRNEERPLPAHVVAEDRRLERVKESATEALMRLRWHWTLDESNPERVSFRAYARQIARSHQAVMWYANGYVHLKDDSPGNALVTTPTRAVERAKTSAERYAATEAVATAFGVAFVTARQQYGNDVNAVLHMARERADANQTTVADEARGIAEEAIRTRGVPHPSVESGIEWTADRYYRAAMDVLSAYLATWEEPFVSRARRPALPKAVLIVAGGARVSTAEVHEAAAASVAALRELTQERLGRLREFAEETERELRREAEPHLAEIRAEIRRLIEARMAAPLHPR